jgi:sigma-B regulation protein RsbU (phosphoserine phosphatase)
MTGKSLSRLFGHAPQLLDGLNGLLNSLEHPVCICDVDHHVLAGCPAAVGQAAQPIFVDGEMAGWIMGEAAAPHLAALVEWLVRQEAEKKSLGTELMDRYREVNLLYHLAERLAASPQPESIAKVALAEALRLNKARAGLILAVPDAEPGSALQIRAVQGCPYPSIRRGDLLERVIRTGRADIANDIPGEDYFPEESGQVISLACAPLKTDQRVQGLILLVGDQGNSFSASAIKLLNTIAMQIGPLFEILRLYQVAVENERIERELLMARQVQESLLPTQMPTIPGWEFARRWRPAREVSGDFYDLIEEGPGQLGLVIGDVTDKGMPASLFMVFARTALRASLRHIHTPAGAIQAANQLICQDSFDGLFATLFYARLSTASGALTYVNAGHNPPLLYRARPNEIQLLKRTGLPLGVELSSTYEERTVLLEPGDFILFYTDGITEAIDLAHKEFGMERLQNVIYGLRSSPTDDLLSGLEHALTAFADPSQSFDDITLMVARRL